MEKSKLRGHDIEYVNKEWRYCDTKEPTVKEWRNRPCGVCNHFPTKEGHDHCLGTLPGVMNTCCGHGEREDACIQFLDGFSVHGEDAVVILNILKKYKNEVQT